MVGRRLRVPRAPRESVGVEGPVTSPPFDPLYEHSLENRAPGAYWTCIRISAGGIRAAGRLPRRLPGAPLRGPRSRLPRLPSWARSASRRGWRRRTFRGPLPARLDRAGPTHAQRGAALPAPSRALRTLRPRAAAAVPDRGRALLLGSAVPRAGAGAAAVPAGSLGSAPWAPVHRDRDRHEHRAEKLEPVSVRQYYEHYWSEEGFNPIRPTSTRLHTVLGAHLRGSEQCLDVGCGDGRSIGLGYVIRSAVTSVSTCPRRRWSAHGRSDWTRRGSGTPGSCPSRTDHSIPSSASRCSSTYLPPSR